MNTGLNYCRPEDIAANILLKKTDWFHGIPEIELIGDVGKFGTLKFHFGDEILRMNIYIKDREAILNAAHFAVNNYDKCVKGILLVWGDSFETDRIIGRKDKE